MDCGLSLASLAHRRDLSGRHGGVLSFFANLKARVYPAKGPSQLPATSYTGQDTGTEQDLRLRLYLGQPLKRNFELERRCDSEFQRSLIRLNFENCLGYYVSEPRQGRKQQPNLKTAHAGANTRKPQHLQTEHTDHDGSHWQMPPGRAGAGPGPRGEGAYKWRCFALLQARFRDPSTLQSCTAATSSYCVDAPRTWLAMARASEAEDSEATPCTSIEASPA